MNVCGRSFTQKQHLNRHKGTHTNFKTFKCTICPKRFHQDTNRRRHEKIHGAGIEQAGSSRSESRKRPANSAQKCPFKIVHTAIAFKGATMTWKLIYPKGNSGDEVADLLDRSTSSLREKLLRYQRAKRPIKFNMSIFVIFQQSIDENITTFPPVVLVTEQFEIYADTDIDTVLSTCSLQLQNRITAFEGTGLETRSSAC